MRAVVEVAPAQRPARVVLTRIAPGGLTYEPSPLRKRPRWVKLVGVQVAAAAILFALHLHGLLELILLGVTLAGQETEGGTAQGGATERAVGQRVEVLETGTIEALVFKVTASGTATSTKWAIMADREGVSPVTTEAPKQEVTGPASPSKAETITITGFSVAVTKGETIWLCWEPLGGTLKWKSATSTTTISKSKVTTATINAVKGEWANAETLGPVAFWATGTAGGTTPANIVFNAAAATAATSGALTAPANVSGTATSSAAGSGALSAPANISGVAQASVATTATITAPANIIASASKSNAAASGALTAPALLIASAATSQAGASGALRAPALITAASASALASAIGSLTTGGAAIIAFGTVGATVSATGAFFTPEVAAHHPPRRRPTIGNVAVGDRGRLTRQEGGRAV